MRNFTLAIVIVMVLATTATAARLDNTVLEAGLNTIKNGATVLVLCSSEPSTYSGVAAVSLASKTGLSASSFTGPEAHTSGRKITLAAQSSIAPSANGTVTRACLTDGSSILYGCWNVNSQSVTTSQTWAFPASIIAILAPQ